MTEEYDHVTSDAAVATYEATQPMFDGLIKEVRELSRKKPDATMSGGKVTIINRVLSDLLAILKEEPEGKYLDLLNDQSLPHLSDAVLMMVQFETALRAFRNRYQDTDSFGERYWITPEYVEARDNREDDDGDQDEDEEEDDS